VPVTASGPWASGFVGTHQNTEVFFSMRRALDWWLWLPMIHR
jgi:alkaline phosphatase